MRQWGSCRGRQPAFGSRPSPLSSSGFLCYARARFDFRVTAQHTPGVTTIAADALSRNNLHLFFVQAPHASSHPTVVTPDLLPQLSWCRPAWSLTRLDDLVRYFLQNALVPSTRRTYQSRYLSFCSLFDLRKVQGRAHCHNAAVGENIYNGRAKDPLHAHQLRAFFYVCMFEITAVNTPGQENGTADAISRNNLDAAFSQAPTAGRYTSVVPVELQLGLSRARPCWRSLDWMAWLPNSLTRLYCTRPHRKHGTPKSARPHTYQLCI